MNEELLKGELLEGDVASPYDRDVFQSSLLSQFRNTVTINDDDPFINCLPPFPELNVKGEISYPILKSVDHIFNIGDYKFYDLLLRDDYQKEKFGFITNFVNESGYLSEESIDINFTPNGEKTTIEWIWDRMRISVFFSPDQSRAHLIFCDMRGDRDILFKERLDKVNMEWLKSNIKLKLN